VGINQDNPRAAPVGTAAARRRKAISRACHRPLGPAPCRFDARISLKTVAAGQARWLSRRATGSKGGAGLGYWAFGCWCCIYRRRRWYARGGKEKGIVPFSPAPVLPPPPGHRPSAGQRRDPRASTLSPRSAALPCPLPSSCPRRYLCHRHSPTGRHHHRAGAASSPARFSLALSCPFVGKMFCRPATIGRLKFGGGSSLWQPVLAGLQSWQPSRFFGGVVFCWCQPSAPPRLALPPPPLDFFLPALTLAGPLSGCVPCLGFFLLFFLVSGVFFLAAIGLGSSSGIFGFTFPPPAKRHVLAALESWSLASPPPAA